MKAINRVLEVTVPQDLTRVIEPLASYICASEKPKTALLSALALLCREIEANNRAASAHFRATLAV